MKRLKGFNLILSLWVIVILSGSCNYSDHKIQNRSTVPGARRTNQETPGTSIRSGHADPASEKCAGDGFILKPVLVNGVPVSTRCFNPETGKECDTWAYFRGECSLSAH